MRFTVVGESGNWGKLTVTCSYTVTGDKLAFFLKKCVVGRAKKKGGRSKKDAPADDDDETGGAPAQTVAWQTVDQYIATIVNLYEDQRRAGVDSHAHPRGGGVEEIMATMRRGVAQKKGLEFTNRGIGELTSSPVGTGC